MALRLLWKIDDGFATAADEHHGIIMVAKWKNESPHIVYILRWDEANQIVETRSSTNYTAQVTALALLPNGVALLPYKGLKVLRFY